MDEEKLYKEYLKSVFYPVNETYFYNVNTRELIPDHLALDDISNYDLNYIIRCMYDIYDMFGFTEDEIKLIETTIKKYERYSPWFKRYMCGPSSVSDEELQKFINELENA